MSTLQSNGHNIYTHTHARTHARTHTRTHHSDGSEERSQAVHCVSLIITLKRSIFTRWMTGPWVTIGRKMRMRAALKSYTLPCVTFTTDSHSRFVFFPPSIYFHYSFPFLCSEALLIRETEMCLFQESTVKSPPLWLAQSLVMFCIVFEKHHVLQPQQFYSSVYCVEYGLHCACKCIFHFLYFRNCFRNYYQLYRLLI